MEPITFGKKKALLVKSFSEKEKNRHTEVLHNLRELTSIKLWEKEKEEWSYDVFEQLKQVPYLMRPVLEKRNNNGELKNCPDYFFFLTTIQNKKICFFIEKNKPLEKAVIYQNRFRFKDELFKGTLFSGTLFMSDEIRTAERVEITNFFSEVFTTSKREVSAPLQQNNWIFLINDIWAYSGKDVSSTLSHRLVQVQDILGKDWFPDSKLDVCDFDTASYYNYNEIEDFLKNKRKYFPYEMSDHKVHIVCTQGIPGSDEYSISLKSPIPKQNDSAVFKNGEWNVSDKVLANEALNQEKKNMLLKMSEYPDVYWVYNPSDMTNVGPARVRTLEESKELRNLFKDKNFLQIECKWIQEFEKWQPILYL